MKSFTAVLVLLMVLFFHAGESYKWWKICKDEKVSQPPFTCGQPRCDQFCAELHHTTRGWGKCKDDDRYVCQCFYICYQDVPFPPTNAPAQRPMTYLANLPQPKRP